MDQSPQLRPDLADLPSYRAGARAADAVSLASNESVGGPLPEVVAAIARAAGDSHRYPDPVANQLLERLSVKLGVDADQVALGTGSVAICQQITTSACSPGDEVIYAWRSFEAYPIVTRLAHAKSIQIPLRPDARHDLPAMRDAITERTRVIFVCTPNNPTGPAIPTQEIAEFLEQVPKNVLVVVDEAYLEYAGASGAEFRDTLDLVNEHHHAMVLRTFSKAYGLAGLRVGYGVGQAEVVAGLRKAATPFGVNHLAQAAAMAALEKEHEVAERAADTVRERDRVVAQARHIGWDVPDTQANFYWLPLGSGTDRFAQACAAAGVIVRAFSGEGVRVTIGEPQWNDRVLQVLRDFGEPPADE